MGSEEGSALEVVVTAVWTQRLIAAASNGLCKEGMRAQVVKDDEGVKYLWLNARRANYDWVAAYVPLDELPDESGQLARYLDVQIKHLMVYAQSPWLSEAALNPFA